jgi:predicted permease
MIRDLFETLSRVVAVFRRRSLDREFDDEFTAHLELLTARNEERGLPRTEARRQAILQLGGLNGAKNLHREARGLPRLDRILEGMSGFGRDLLHAARALAKAPGFTFVCVTSLSVGMGLVIAIPYVAQLLFMPPAGVKTDGLVEVLMTPRGPLRVQVGGWARTGWAYADYADLRDARTGMTLTGWAAGESIVTLPASARVERLPVGTMFVSANYFRTVGVSLARGPGFDENRAAAAEPAVVLGYTFWENRLGSDPEIIGKTLTVNGTPHVVVGIAPEGYCRHLAECPGGQSGQGMPLFMPLERHPRLVADERLRADRDSVLVRIHGRLSPGVSREQANAAVSSVMSGLAQRYPSTNEYKAASVEPYFAMGSLERSGLALIQAAFFAVTGMVLLVVCLNISGMMQARSAIRERELAVRLAIGAGRGRLVQYLLSEALMLASVAGALAVLVLFGVPQAVFWRFGQSLPPHVQQHIWQVLRPSLATGALAVGLCVVTSLVFGLLPAVRFSRPTLVTALKDEAGGGGRRIGRVHRFTAALQVAIAMPFLVVSGTAIDWVRTTMTSDLGFKPDGLAAAALNLDRVGDERDRAFLLRRLRGDLELAQGVQSVTVADTLPLDFTSRAGRVSRPDRSDYLIVRLTRAGDGYLETLGIPLVRGRGISAADEAGSESVAVVSALAANRLFGSDDPIGKPMTLEIEPNRRRVFTIVGVTADFVGRSLDMPRAHVLIPLAQHPTPRVALIARAAAGVQPMTLTPAFRTAVREVDPDFTDGLITGDRLKANGMEDILVPANMVGFAGGVVLVLAALGIYGVIGFMVATRTREIAVRVALGASRRRVLATIQSDVVRLVVPGVVGGLLLGIAVARLVVPWRGLMGAAMEPLIYLLAVAVAVLVASLAGMPPARRAASIDPMVAMRSE